MIRSLKDIWYSVTSPEKYRDFMNYKTGRLLLYVFTLVLISGIFTMILPAGRFLASGGFGRIIEEDIPDFTVSSDGQFWIEHPIEIDEYNFFIKADSDVVKEDVTDLDGDYGTYDYVIVVDKEQFYIKVAGTQEFTSRFDEMENFEFSREDLKAYVPVMYLSYLWVFILATLIDFGYYFIVAFVVSWLAGVVAALMKVLLGSRPLFRMSVYAGTLSYLLGLVQTLIGKSVPNFSFFSFLISLGYMYFAIKEIRGNGDRELPPEQFGREG